METTNLLNRIINHPVYSYRLEETWKKLSNKKEVEELIREGIGEVNTRREQNNMRPLTLLEAMRKVAE